MRIAAIILLLLVGFNLRAQSLFTNVFSFVNAMGVTQNVRQVSIEPLQALGVYGDSIIVPDVQKLTVKTNTLPVPLMSGYSYRVKYYASVSPELITATFTNYFSTNVLGVVSASDYVTISTNLGSGIYAYSQQQSDARFALAGSTPVLPNSATNAITNNASGVTLAGTFSGNGLGITNLGDVYFGNSNIRLQIAGGEGIYLVPINTNNGTSFNIGDFTEIHNSLYSGIDWATDRIHNQIVGNIDSGAGISVLMLNTGTIQTIGDFGFQDIQTGSFNGTISGNGIGLTNIQGSGIAGLPATNNIAARGSVNVFTASNNFTGGLTVNGNTVLTDGYYTNRSDVTVTSQGKIAIGTNGFASAAVTVPPSFAFGGFRSYNGNSSSSAYIYTGIFGGYDSTTAANHGQVIYPGTYTNFWGNHMYPSFTGTNFYLILTNNGSGTYVEAMRAYRINATGNAQNLWSNTTASFSVSVPTVAIIAQSNSLGTVTAPFTSWSIQKY